MADIERTSSLTKPIWSPLLDEHLAEVTRINAEIQAHPWNLKHWQSSQLPNYRNWVILDPQPIAYISFMLAQDTAELMNIGVSSSYQSQGIGRALIAGGIGLLPEAVVKGYLEVRQSNKTARKLYESMGFQVIAKRANYYPVDEDRREPAIVYILENEGMPVKDIDFYQESGKLDVVKKDLLMGKGRQND
jgi:ribosomal-protein-alanine N-acetyltransferase